MDGAYATELLSFVVAGREPKGVRRSARGATKMKVDEG